MVVRYQRGKGGRLHPVYECSRAKTDYGGELCQQLSGTCVDRYVIDLLLAAMAPAVLEISLQAAEQAQHRRAEVDRIWRQRLERADQAAGRARRQYQLAEPEHRLVVRELERNWERALAEQQQLGEEYDRFVVRREHHVHGHQLRPGLGIGGDLTGTAVLDLRLRSLGDHHGRGGGIDGNLTHRSLLCRG
jgi:hypothetical protein